MIRRMILMLVIMAVVLGGYFGFQQFKGKMIHQFLSSMANPPQVVSTVTATTQTWQPEVQAVGSLRAVNGATLSLEVGGVVDQIGFKSGDDVPAGRKGGDGGSDEAVHHPISGRYRFIARNRIGLYRQLRGGSSARRCNKLTKGGHLWGRARRPFVGQTGEGGLR